MQRVTFIVIAMVAALLLNMGVASASPGAGIPPPTDGGSQGKGATTVKYQASYTSVIGGQWECAGVRGVHKDATKDSFACTMTDLASLPAGTYIESNGSFVWQSDYDQQLATSWTLVVSDSGDGTGSVEGVAYYL
jgi:hypothetical protein